MKERMTRKLMGELRQIMEAGEDEKVDFWAGKTPCWQMCHCPTMIKEDCPVSRYKFLACWEIEGTYCKLEMNGTRATGASTACCEVCRVYKKYGEGKPIELKLRGKGINTVMNSARKTGLPPTGSDSSRRQAG